MKGKSNKDYTLGKFLGQYGRTGLLFLAYTLIFMLVFSLYRLEAEAVAYAAALCGLLTAAVLAAVFFLGRRKHGRLRRIAENAELMPEELPEPATVAEADYQEIVFRLKSLYDANLDAWQRQREESMDYYTTWVHQIKTPIAVMRMTLQEEDTKEHRELAAELFRIEQYVEMALDYLRLLSDSSDYVFQEYDLDHIIRQAVHKYAPWFVKNKIRLNYTPSGRKVLTDEKWLLFIIEQLLSNAVKYAYGGEVSISVTGEGQLVIADTGIGIAPEDVPRIFEKGFTGYNGRADKKSTGLGLYLCRRAADALSHKISVESRVGEGTAFTIDLSRERLMTE